MEKHRQYEFFAAAQLESMGYTDIDVTQAVGDWGADAFCEKDGKRYIIQAKMYGSCKTKVSRKDLMELYGSMAYFDCQGAILVYSGKINSDAIKVADKLQIELLYLDNMEMEIRDNELGEDHVPSFSMVIEELKTLTNVVLTNGTINYRIIDMSETHITALNLNTNNTVKIKLACFKWVVDRLHHYNGVHATDVRDEFHIRHSSFVALVFNNLSNFSVTKRTISLKKDYK